MDPVISIITPLFNKADYVAETAKSILGQDCTNWEWLVVDNLSTDRSVEIVRAQVGGDPRVWLLSQEKPGPGATRNLGLRHARGRWVLFLDADDLLESNYLQRMVELGEGRHAGVVAAPWKCYSDAESHGTRDYKVLYPHGYPEGHPLPSEIGIASTCWAVHAAIVRREWLLDGREWPEELDGYLGEDTAFWFRVVLNASIAYSDYAGAIYRQHTTDCRSNYTPKPWFEGNHRSISANVAFLEKKGVAVSAGQAENLVGVYSGFYIHAHACGDEVTAESAIREASRWLKYRTSLIEPSGLAMKFRSIVGIPIYEKIRSMLRGSPCMLFGKQSMTL